MLAQRKRRNVRFVRQLSGEMVMKIRRVLNTCGCIMLVIGSSLFAVKVYFYSHDSLEEMRTGFLMYIGLSLLSTVVMWHAGALMLRREERLAIERWEYIQELRQREEAWEEDRSQLIATAVETVMQQLRREKLAESEENVRHLRAVRLPRAGDN